MIIVDTNVLSEPMRPSPDPRVMRWLHDQDPAGLFTTATVIAELSAGIARMPAGARRDAVARAIDEVVTEELAGRVLPFDLEAAIEFGALSAARESSGHALSMADGQIAAVCLTNGAALATRNTRDFEELGIDLIDPWAVTS
ncbi:type II toxin-antitoxin system VapC family toxin [soil metagenome]